MEDLLGLGGALGTPLSLTSDEGLQEGLSLPLRGANQNSKRGYKCSLGHQGGFGDVSKEGHSDSAWGPDGNFLKDTGSPCLSLADACSCEPWENGGMPALRVTDLVLSARAAPGSGQVLREDLLSEPHSFPQGRRLHPASWHSGGW